MNRKSKALKGLLALAIVIALCMFFARTVQTITTPKIQRISSTRGRLEQKISLTGEVYFPEIESVKIPEAKELGITIEQVNVRAGHYVNAGDVLFTAYAPQYADKMKELKDKREEKIEEYASEYAAHIRLNQTSAQNDYYNEMLDAIDAYYNARYAVMMQAAQEGYTLTASSYLGRITDGSETLKALSEELQNAAIARDTAVNTLRDLYEGRLAGVYRIGDSTFDYIKKIDGLREEIDEYDQQMLELEQLNLTLASVTAPHAGYITSFELKSGDSYDGTKAAYEMTAEDGLPVLRAEITNVDKPVSEGQSVQLQQGSATSEISGIETAADGKKYAYVKLDSKTIQSAGGLSRMMRETGIALTINYRAAKSTTLLPASAVRSDGSGGYYVYVVERSYGGLLDSSGYKLSKRQVTVLEKSDQIVSLSDDLSYCEIADREDRALSEGQAVMDYVD